MELWIKIAVILVLAAGLMFMLLDGKIRRRRLAETPSAPPPPQQKRWPRYPDYAQPPDWYTAVDVARVEAHKDRFVGYAVSTVTDVLKAEQAVAVILRGVLKKYSVVWAMDPDEAYRRMAEFGDICCERYLVLSEEYYRGFGRECAAVAYKTIRRCQPEALLKDFELTCPKRYHGAPCSGGRRDLYANDEDMFVADALEFIDPIQLDSYRGFPNICSANLSTASQLSRHCRDSFELEYGYFNQVPASVRERIQAEEMFLASAFAMWVIYGNVIILAKPKHVVFEGDKIVEMYWGDPPSKPNPASHV